MDFKIFINRRYSFGLKSLLIFIISFMRLILFSQCSDVSDTGTGNGEEPIQNFIVNVKNNIISLGEVLTITIKNTSQDSATAYLDIKYPTGTYIRSFIGPYTLNQYEDPIEITWDSSEDSAMMDPKY